VAVLRITQGEKKGSELLVPKDIEPVKNVVKLAVFSMLGEIVKDANCLDLFAGSGNLGFTALSLGAGKCVFVDDTPASIACIKQNSKKLSFENEVTIVENNVENFLSFSLPAKYNIIFLDPPYKLTIDNIAEKLLNCISKEGVIVYLHHKDTEARLRGFCAIDQRVYGKTKVSLLQCQRSNVKSQSQI